ncbi:MAG TPA: hypothetical protein VF184_11210, partial [Phycisphaeraceae bacterium]
LSRAHADRRAASAVSLGGGIITAAAVGLILGGLGGGASDDESARRWWWAAALLIVLQQLMLVYRDALASQRQFGWSAVAMIGFAALSTAGGIVGAVWGGLGGFLIGQAAAYVVVVAGCSVLGPTFPLPAWRAADAWRLVRLGWPIAVGHALLIVLWNVDKLALWMLRSPHDLGVYAIQAYFTAAVMLLPATVSAVFSPHLRLRLGATRDPRSAQPFLLQGMELLGLASLPVIGLGALAMHLPIRWLTPDYAQAIVPGRLLMLVSFMSVIASVASGALVALSHQQLLLVIRILSVAVSGGLAVGVLAAGGGLVALAAAVSAGFTVHAVWVVAAAMRAARISVAQAGSLLKSIAWPYAMTIVAVVILLAAIPDAPRSPVADLMLTAARCAILMLLGASLWRRVWRSLNLPSTAEQGDRSSMAYSVDVPTA